MMKKSSKNGIILFDNSSIQNLNLTPEDFGKRNDKLISFEFSDKDGSEYLDKLFIILLIQIYKVTSVKFFNFISFFKNLAISIIW